MIYIMKIMLSGISMIKPHHGLYSIAFTTETMYRVSITGVSGKPSLSLTALNETTANVAIAAEALLPSHIDCVVVRE